MSERPVRTVAIRWLAEMAHRRGDLYPYRGSEQLRVATRADEGIATQRRMQRDRPAGYRVEHPVRQRVTVGGVTFELRGRVDGAALDTDPALIEEFKTTRTDVQTVFAHDGAVHWAQARLYAALLAREHPQIRKWRLRLLYCHPDSDECCTYERTAGPRELESFLDETLKRLRPQEQRRHEQARNAWLAGRPFPFASYRPHQRAVARRCYQALKGGGSLLIEAPTGSGKTMAMIYPSLKSLALQGSGKVFFLTSRNTGALAVRAALATLDSGREHLRHVTITAKEKACIVAGMPCSAERCRYARGYYDKRDAAVAALLAHRASDSEVVETVARQYEVCPFELSLDAAVWSDVVICDYNYVFDPVVRLQRFMADDEIDLLVDEAHQLGSRAADMLSVSLDRHLYKAALAECNGDGVAKRLKSIDRALLALRRRYGSNVETVIEQPQPLTRAIGRLLEELQTTEFDLAHFPVLQGAVFAASRWLRSENWRTPGAFEYLLDTREGGIAIRSQCLDPSSHLRDTFARYRGNIRFSGTLSPLALYNQLHGLDAAPCERAASPFDEGQIAVLLVRDIDTYFRGRDASIGQLVKAVHAVTSANPGHYLVAFPSYGYLHRFAGAARGQFPDSSLLCQTPDMTQGDQNAFLEALHDNTRPLLAAVVLGGVFAESVDLAAAPLAGVIAVGVGVPPPDLARNCQRRYFDTKSGNGQQVAFLQPAMTRIVQAAGRLLRSPEQRGVICLIDPRFAYPDYRRFFPSHWQPQTVPASDLGKAVANFWKGSMLPADSVPCGLEAGP